MSGVTFYEKLEEGSFGTVYSAHDMYHGQVAVKIVRKPLCSGSIDQAAVIALVHPHIVRHYRCFLVNGREFAYVMELAPNKDLFEYSKTKLSEHESMRLVGELFAGLEYLHSRLLVHMDLKRENCMMMAGARLAIADFDFARRRGTPFDGLIGTVESWAPEIAEAASRGRSAAAGMGAEFTHDYWAAGIIAWELETGLNRCVRTAEQIKCLMQFEDPFMVEKTALSKVVNAACRRNPKLRVLTLLPVGEHEDQDDDRRKHERHGGVRSRSC